MQYRNCFAPAQPPEGSAADAVADGLADANINPATGLATDYLNHFNEAIMLLEMLPVFPDSRDDLLAWRPMTYREHFAASGFSGRDLAIAAYETADPDARLRLETLVAAMNEGLETARAAISEMADEAAGAFAMRTAATLRPLAARALAVINGEADPAETPQAAVDGLMNR